MAWVFPPEELQRLIQPRRFRWSPPYKTLRRIGLRKGMDVVDVGCGPGFWTLPAAKIAGPSSQVFASDISPKMLAAARQRTAEAGRLNIRFKRSRVYGVPFESECADFCMLHYVLHEVDDPARLMAEGARVLRPGGLLSAYEWARVKSDEGPPYSDRIPDSKMRKLFRSAGLRPKDFWMPDPLNYILVGKKV